MLGRQLLTIVSLHILRSYNVLSNSEYRNSSYANVDETDNVD